MPVRQLALVAAVAFATSACSTASKLLGDDPPPPQAQAYQDLTMPPDLQLRAPGTVQAPDMVKPTETVTINEDAAPIGEEAAADAAVPEITSQSPTAQTTEKTTASAGTTDIYAKYGISKVKPDGTPKNSAELAQELRKAQIAEKQQKNPNYGTVWNLGNIFKDE